MSRAFLTAPKGVIFFTRMSIITDKTGGKAMPKPLSVVEAAARLGVDPQFLRLGLQQGRFPFGTAVKMRKQWSYYINPVQFREYLRGEVEVKANG